MLPISKSCNRLPLKILDENKRPPDQYSSSMIKTMDITCQTKLPIDGVTKNDNLLLSPSMIKDTTIKLPTKVPSSPAIKKSI